MTDIRALLAEEIWQSDTESQAPRPGMWHDLNVNWQMYYLDRADRLLSLPGIAVVDLEADIDRLADALRRADTEVFASNPADEYEKRTRNMVKAVLSAAAQAQEH